MNTTPVAVTIDSDALDKNLKLTNVEVVVPKAFEAMVDVVKGYAGKERQAWDLLTEYHHKYRNWKFVIQECKRYSISNFRLYQHHPLNGAIVYLISEILFHALSTSERSEIRGMAADELIAFWIKVAEDMSADISKPLPEGLTVERVDGSIEGNTSCHSGIL